MNFSISNTFNGAPSFTFPESIARATDCVSGILVVSQRRKTFTVQDVSRSCKWRVKFEKVVGTDTTDAIS